MKKVVLTVILCVFAISGIVLVVMYNLGDRLIEEAILNDLLSEENTAADQPAENAEDAEDLQPAETTDGSNPSESTDNHAAAPGTPESTGAGNKNRADKPKAEPKAKTKPVLIDAQVNEIKDEVAASDKIAAAAL